MEAGVESPQKKSVFASNDNVNFFQFNLSNDLMKNFEATQALNDRTKFIMQKAKEKRKDMNTLIVTKGIDKIIQPVFMENQGSLCFTEFWSSEQRYQYTKGMEEEQFKRVKIDNRHRQNYEGLYKPEKWKKQRDIRKKIETLIHDDALKQKNKEEN